MTVTMGFSHLEFSFVDHVPIYHDACPFRHRKICLAINDLSNVVAEVLEDDECFLRILSWMIMDDGAHQHWTIFVKLPPLKVESTGTFILPYLV